jgi:hypothetical protein
LSKTDDILLELDRSVATYLRSIPPFKYEKKTFHLTDNYVAVPHMKCDLCGQFPLFVVSVIESDDGEQLHVGDSCIDNLTGYDITNWFKNFREKRESVLANRKYVDQLALILDAYDKKALPFELSSVDAEKMRAMFDQIVSGKKLTASQIQMAEDFLISKVAA